MNKTGRKLVNIPIVLASAILASALMLKFTGNDSWLAFIGWVIFYVAILAPFLFNQSSPKNGCTAWLTRFRKGE